MSTVEITKLLVNRDQRLSITVLVIKPPPILGSGSAITTYIESLTKKSLDRVSFVELPQDETPPSRNPKAPLTSFDQFINRHCKYVRNVGHDRHGAARVSGFVIDMFCMGMIDVANEFNVPTYVIFTSNAAFLGFEMYLLSFCDNNQKQDVVELISNSADTLPVSSFVKPVPTKVLPATMVKTREGMDANMKLVRKLKKAKGNMVNTFLELETHAIKSLSSDSSVPFVYPVGPLLNIEGGAGKSLDDGVKRWLDGQPSSSVVFLCFGSMGSFEEVQVKEIAYALERSGHRFVWSLRQPASEETTYGNPSDYEDPRVVLPEGFMERTIGVGKVIWWAPQVALMAHRAIGGFVSHCGWNLMLESTWFGVPIVAWPMYAEQQMNAFDMVVELGLGVEIKMDYMKDLFNPKANIEIVTADEIESGIRRLMADEMIRTKAKEMSDRSRMAVAKGGSSYASVGCLVQDFMTNIS